MSSTTLQNYINDQNSVRMGNGWNTSWPGNMDTMGVSTTGANSVIGWQSASLPVHQTGGAPNHNTILLDGPRSQYLVDVASNGGVTVEDSTNGQ